MKKDNIKKYLDNYAEPEINSLPVLKNTWEEVIIIPCHNEYTELITLLTENIPTIKKDQKLLVLLVINANEESRDEVFETNNKLINFIENTTKTKISELITLVPFHNYDLLIIDKNSKARCFDKKHGVGLARKIGVDVALKIYQQGNLTSQWLRCTDADVVLPENYLELKPDEKKYSAITFPFYHTNILDNNLGKALQVYEMYLRYYLFGLIYANSPYAFHTVGSCISISATAYAEVRGFPKKREAAEDFYMLNKLAKINKIFIPDNAVISIKCRESDRVPFGTGASMGKISKIFDNKEDYKIYNPIVFEHLKTFYDLIEAFCIHKDLEKLETTDEVLNQLISAIEIKEVFANSLKLSKDTSQIKKHIHTWFDAFRILKFVHYLTNNFYPALPWKEALSKTPFLKLDLNLELEELRRNFLSEELKAYKKVQS